MAGEILERVPYWARSASSGSNTDAYVSRAVEGADKETAAHEQRERESHLRHDERVPKPAAGPSRRAATAALQPADEIHAAGRKRRRKPARLSLDPLAIAAAAALLLGAIGIYGVVSYIVTQRTGEIGVRLAMGAEPGSVAGMILRQGGGVTLAGIVVRLIAALAGGRLIESLLYGVTPRDPAVLSVTTLILLGIALLACWLPGAQRGPPQSTRGAADGLNWVVRGDGPNG